MAEWIESSGTSGTIGALSGSADGRILLAGASYGPAYRSTNYGATWAPILPIGQNSWRAAASSGDGQTLLLGAANGPAYRSADGGASWTGMTLPAGQWTGLRVSRDGVRQAAAGYNGSKYGLWVSTDAGASWVDRTPPGLSSTSYLTMSDDGRRLVAATSDYTGSFRYSADGGTTWQASGPIDAGYASFRYRSLSASRDGSRVVAVADDGGRVYLSGDGGATWKTAATPANHYGGAVGISGDGVTLAATSSNGTDLSQDGGKTWGHDARASYGAGNVFISQDGSHVITAAGTKPGTLKMPPLFPVQSWRNMYFGAQPVQALYLGSRQIWAKP